MRVLIQRVSLASVQIADKEYSNIGRGLLILLGIENEDLEEDVDWPVSYTHLRAHET